MNTRSRETVLVDKQEYNADQILTAIDFCLCLEYLVERRFSRTPLSRGIIASVVLFVMATTGFSLPRHANRVFQDDITPETVQTAGEPRLLPPHLNHTVPLNEGIQLPVPPKKDVQVPEKTIASKNPEAAAARRNLATVLKRGTDQGMLTINLLSDHERTLFASLDPACPNCGLLEPALERLASDFNVAIYPASVISGEESTNRVTPLLCEKDAQKRAAGWHRLCSINNGTMTPPEETTPADETCLKATRAAIDVDDVAFRKFGFAGTPWVLPDTGWHLSIRVLQETGTLNLFLRTTDSEPGHE